MRREDDCEAQPWANNTKIRSNTRILVFNIDDDLGKNRNHVKVQRNKNRYKKETDALWHPFKI